MTITMLGGEPAVLIWRSADLGATLDAAGDLGLPVACSWSIAAEFGFQEGDGEGGAEQADVEDLETDPGGVNGC